MQIKPITDPSFAQFGFIIDNYNFSPLLNQLRNTTEKPTNSVIYHPTDATLESLPIFTELRDTLYGGMPIQIGYCNGSNHKLECLEYHRGSELNIAADDIILLLAPLQKLKNHTLDTNLIEAFSVPAGSAVVLYETTLHYAPCNGENNDGFRVIVILPRDTNTDKPNISPKTSEDKLLWAKNKWLIAHPDTYEAKQGAFVGLIGENITL